MSMFLRTLEPFRELRDLENRLQKMMPKPTESNVAGFHRPSIHEKGITLITSKWIYPV